MSGNGSKCFNMLFFYVTNKEKPKKRLPCMWQRSVVIVGTKAHVCWQRCSRPTFMCALIKDTDSLLISLRFIFTIKPLKRHLIFYTNDFKIVAGQVKPGGQTS